MLERYINKNSYVELVLKDEIPEENLSSGIPFINDKRITILEIYKLIQTIKRSSAEGILVKIKSLNIGYARAFEIRYLLLNLRNAGKKVFIYIEDAGNIEYFIATSADKIFIPPWSTLNLVGLSLENFFLKELLDKLYIEPEIDGFGEYKSAADMFNRKEMSSYHKEMMETVLENHFNSLITEISSARNIPGAELKKIIDNNPMNSGQAKSNNLVDEISYENEVREFIKHESYENTNFIKYEKFIRKNKYSRILKEIKRFIKSNKKYIGVININGMITQGISKTGNSYIRTCGSDTSCELIKKAADDKSVLGVIVRVLSPGGSALASDLIRNEIQILSERKPVVISMSDVAASGGYMISLSSNKIIANPFTITGSIGVVAGKFNFKKFLNKYGINNEILQKGKMASIYSTNKKFTKDEKIKFTELIKEMYNEFVKMVSDKRNLDLKDTEKAAKGRIWVSVDAKKLGLIDEIGTYYSAIKEIQDISEWKENEELFLKEFKTKNKLSFSNIGKLNQFALMNNLYSLIDALNKERLYTIVPYFYRMN